MQHRPCQGGGRFPIFRHVESDGNRAVADNRMCEIMNRMTLNQKVAFGRALTPATDLLNVDLLTSVSWLKGDREPPMGPGCGN